MLWIIIKEKKDYLLVLIYYTSIQINIHHWIIQQLYKNSNVFPTPYASTPVAMTIQSASSTKSSIIILTTSYNPNNSSLPAVTKTTDVPDYDTAQVSQVPLTNTVQALASIVNSVDVQSSTVISTQPHTKYR